MRDGYLSEPLRVWSTQLPTSASAQDDTVGPRWPDGTQVIQNTWYQPGLDVNLGPAIHVRMHLTPDWPPERLLLQLQRMVHEFTTHLANGSTRGNQDQAEDHH